MHKILLKQIVTVINDYIEPKKEIPLPKQHSYLSNLLVVIALVIGILYVTESYTLSEYNKTLLELVNENTK